MKRQKEEETVSCMISIYCRGKHKQKTLCPECRELLDYAELRLSKCPHGDQKPFCSNCRIHCYKPDKKEKIRQVMRYAGPRMLFYHPVIALRHMAEMRKDRRKQKHD
ncbi:nitrous oxide-stimulated promoter family protein [Lacrimispora sp. NSJ-141]|uniref:Nitrous oxide-stimulated promoter family protein n=1 Tax=Lientehia hominis TaxID=2897778 RepID=A0AAP2W976_9FIRM|nr:nitrous oxide-stimulated promoter family protein [Lientehia hominis]MCD2491562.1 nitrous oxide-stimulated promoter family protein [Lientehia hominis]